MAAMAEVRAVGSGKAVGGTDISRGSKVQGCGPCPGSWKLPRNIVPNGPLWAGVPLRPRGRQPSAHLEGHPGSPGTVRVESLQVC